MLQFDDVELVEGVYILGVSTTFSVTCKYILSNIYFKNFHSNSYFHPSQYP